ncbi:L-lactate permease [Salinibacterium hongtaonis]|uniref:L-lactate permease n=1 Tax=Homoserinimonas hongtaonis TaxID=2079791 RepID=A0A2U1T148_9MICO|nr:L-lactate permease [Salinibacterium hongtaonis]PWB97601.1 hypothetical protein DF220_06975 [Salinibacterium hongtaonis]
MTLDLLLAAAPLVLIATLLAFRMPPIPSILVVIAITLALSFRFPIDADAAHNTLDSLIHVSIAVLFIILGGIMLAESLTASGAQDAIGSWVERAAGSKGRAVILIGLGVSPLAESIIGWGLGIIICVPLLLRIGLSATRAAGVALFGLVISAWGSLGPGNLLLSESTGVDYIAITTWTAILSLPGLVIMGTAMLLLGLGRREARAMLPELALTIAVVWSVLVAGNLVSPPLAGILASLAGIATVLVLSRIREGSIPALDPMTRRALAPYGILVVSMLGATALASLLDLGPAEDVATSPALWLMITAVIAPLIFRLTGTQLTSIVAKGLRRWLPVATTTVLFIAFGGLLTATGMTETLSEGAAELGRGFLLLVPLIGFIGGYTTGSGTGAAAMFATGTAGASSFIGVDPAVALGGQNAATSTSTMTTPSRVALAAGMTAGLAAGDRINIPRLMGWLLGTNALVLLALAPLTLLLA